ncbi:MAG: hypothetical protein AAGA93_06520 [Actinomycetota bacterium]
MAVLWLLAASACSSPDDDASETPSSSSSSTTPADDPDGEPDDEAGVDPGGTQAPDADDVPDADDAEAEQAARALLGELGGQLALGSGPAVAVARPDGGALQVIGVDGENGAQPTWSRDGTALVWSSTSPERQVVLVQSFDDDGRPDGDPAVSDTPGFPIFYLQWSADDTRLAYLRSAAQPGQVEFGLIDPGDPAEPVAQDTPFFLSWSPAAAESGVLAHVAQNRVELHTPGAAEPRIVLDQGSDYSAPAWVDGERALVVADEALALVSLVDGSVEQLVPMDVPVRFVVSPDGRRVAYRRLTESNQGPLTASLTIADSATSTDEDSSLVVLDLETGESEVVGDDTATAWEWSPDGSRLAWLSVRTSGRLLGSWNFWSADGQQPATDRTVEFALTRKYAEVYLPFFAQYTHSVTGWAPDSNAFAFPGLIGDERGVWVQLLDVEAEALQVSVGDFVTWGPGPTPDEEGGPSAA